MYSPEGSVGQIGDRASLDLHKIALRISKLESIKSSKENRDNNKKRKNLRKRCSLLRTKMRNKINDLHWKTASYLCKNFNVIILPKFEPSKKIEKIPRRIRKIGKTTVRQMLELSHGKFLQKIKHTIGKYSNKLLFLVEEDYTSKICTNCGRIKEDLNGSEIYKCSHCKHKINRDLNGARNIYIKFLTEIK